MAFRPAECCTEGSVLGDLLFVCLFSLEIGVSLCSPDWPGTLYVAQVGLELTERSACLCLCSAGIKGECHHARATTLGQTFLLSRAYEPVLLIQAYNLPRGDRKIRGPPWPKSKFKIQYGAIGYTTCLKTTNTTET